MKHHFYNTDSIKAVDAKFEAQRIAFGPLVFQAVRALRDLGILEKVADCGERGVAPSELAGALGLSVYGVGVLLEMGLGAGVVKLAREDSLAGGQPPSEGETELCYTLGKIGHFILYDRMTRVNMDFVGEVCYAGAEALEASIRSGKPEGLKVFGAWNTIYEGLSRLPAKVKESWFAFDHYYSDIAFPEALPLVFSRKPRRLFDIGGNTAKWAIACCLHDALVEVLIVDLPGQVEAALRNVKAAGLEGRVGAIACDVLDPGSSFPRGADAVWMSQFLDCFSLDQVEAIMAKLRPSLGADCDVYVLEPFWDRQRFEAASYSLQATSLYFSCMANGDSKMYRCEELTQAVRRAGFELAEAHHDLGANSYSLLRFRRTA